jgi:ubiquinone/menaquinone biosynthesis C-methylase UbiE
MRAASLPHIPSEALKRGAPIPKNGAPNFDGLARAYRWMEYFTFGPLLMRCRTEFLSYMTDRRNALIIGDGDGRFTARLLRLNPALRINAIDASPEMLHALMQRAGKNASRVRTHVADLRAWQPAIADPCDLIVTHFFLDCLTTDEVRSLAAKIRVLAAPNAMWVVSEFAVPSSLFGRFVAAPLVRALYLAFNVLTGLRVRSLPDHASALSDAGFSLASRRARLGGLLISELWMASGER